MRLKELREGFDKDAENRELDEEESDEENPFS